MSNQVPSIHRCSSACRSSRDSTAREVCIYEDVQHFRPGLPPKLVNQTRHANQVPDDLLQLSQRRGRRCREVSAQFLGCKGDVRPVLTEVVAPCCKSTVRSGCSRNKSVGFINLMLDMLDSFGPFPLLILVHGTGGPDSRDWREVVIVDELAKELLTILRIQCGLDKLRAETSRVMLLCPRGAVSED